MTAIGKVKEIQKTELTFEWRIENFFALPEEDGKRYYSPDFLIDEEHWCLLIYPNGSSSRKSNGYISLFLQRKSSNPSKSLSWSFHLKSTKGMTESERKLSHVFTLDENDWGFAKFLERSELLEKKITLIPDGVLTVICTREFSSKSIYEAGETSIYETDSSAAASCSYCKKYLHNDQLSSHEEKCLTRPIRCPTCSDVIELKNWFDHKCPLMRVKANEKLTNDLGSIFDSQEYSDVTVRVKEDELHLHRIILASRNPYFKSMLNTQMHEKSTGIITIKDCEPEDYRSFIHFIYTGKVDNLSVKNAIPLYKLADKYQEDQLKEECVCFMKKEMRADTFCDFTILALTHDEKELLQDATDLFCREIEEIIPSVKWQTFLKQYPIQANELTIKAVSYMSSKLKEVSLKS